MADKRTKICPFIQTLVNYGGKIVPLGEVWIDLLKIAQN